MVLVHYSSLRVQFAGPQGLAIDGAFALGKSRHPPLCPMVVSARSGLKFTRCLGSMHVTHRIRSIDSQHVELLG